MPRKLSIDHFVRRFKAKKLPDERQGKNKQYRINDALLGAFATFFMQSPSFLATQRDLRRGKGSSNAQTIFQMETIPTDTHIRNLLDPVSPNEFAADYQHVLREMERQGCLKPFRALSGRLLIGLDGVQYFSSTKISCPSCSQRQGNNGQTHYSHSVITPVIVAPDQPYVLPFAPEFILPQDGHEKQDCERAATKRWVKQYGQELAAYSVTLLGDDLYSNQPLCELILSQGLNFIFVCKPDSHSVLYEYIDAIAALGRLHSHQRRVWNGRYGEIWQYRYLNQVPLRGGEDALLVNWCEITVIHETDGAILYRNAFVTKHSLSRGRVEEVVRCGRARWKNENENNNVLKNHGYHLEHNFGHGERHLSTTLLTLNLLAFLLHTIADIVDEIYRRIRSELGRRDTFFQDVQALTRYLIFDNWETLLNFMFTQLEIEPAPD
jgi:hypothetical protein